MPALLQPLDEIRQLEPDEVLVERGLEHLADLSIERAPQEPQEAGRSSDDQPLIHMIAPPLIEHRRELAGELLRLDILRVSLRLDAGTTMRAALTHHPRRR